MTSLLLPIEVATGGLVTRATNLGFSGGRNEGLFVTFCHRFRNLFGCSSLARG